MHLAATTYLLNHLQPLKLLPSLKLRQDKLARQTLFNN
jgi:hypothetical protein